MTYQQIRDITYWRYMRECKRLKIEQQGLEDGEFKVYADTVMDEMYRKLNIGDPYVDISITPVSVYTEYALPAGYGGLKGHEITFNSTHIDNLALKPIANQPTSGDLTAGTPNSMSIFLKSDGLYYVYLYPLSAFTGTLRIYYKQINLINAGAGTGADLTEDLPLPSAYYGLLIEGILAQLLPDRISYYYQLLNQAIEDRPIPTVGNIAYNFGGLEDEDYDNGFSKNFNGDC